MLIYKSFFRNKTTKNYLIIYTIILFIFFILNFTKNILIEKENISYNGSFIEINSNDVSNLKNIKNIQVIKETIVIKENNLDKIYLISDDKLQNNEIFINENFKDNKNIILNNEEFIVKDYIKDNENFIYISKFSYDKLKNDNEFRIIVTLKKWHDVDKTILNIKKYYNDVTTHYYLNNDNYSLFIKIIDVFLSLLILLFVIVFVVTSFHIIEDENVKNKIYYKLGYKKISLKIFNIKKIFLLILISFVLSLSIFCLILLIIKR